MKPEEHSGAASGSQQVEAAVAELCARGEGLVTFDADGVLWRGDAGDGFLLWQIENHRLLPGAEREARRIWETYRNGQFGELGMAVFCASCLHGLKEEAVQADAREFFDRCFRTSVIPETRSWANRLQAAGVEVWVVSGSHRWIVTAGSEAVGIRTDRMLTVAAQVRGGVITAEVLLPVTYGVGKAEAIDRKFHRAPDLAFGNTYSDRFMLDMAKVGVAVEPDERLAALAEDCGWPIFRL
jgi:phosphoserine phosphatase